MSTQQPSPALGRELKDRIACKLSIYERAARAARGLMRCYALRWRVVATQTDPDVKKVADEQLRMARGLRDLSQNWKSQPFR